MHLFLFLFSIESNSATGRELQRLMKVPVDSYSDVLTVLKLEKYPTLYQIFDFEGRKCLSLYLLQSILDKSVFLTSLTEV